MSTKLTPDEQIFWEFLNRSHKGHQNAIHAKEIEQELGYNGMNIRELKHGLVIKGYLVGATVNDGYFVIKTLRELNHNMAEIQSRINSLNNLQNSYYNMTDLVR